MQKDGTSLPEHGLRILVVLHKDLQLVRRIVEVHLVCDFPRGACRMIKVYIRVV